jgi:hypothetical protein
MMQEAGKFYPLPVCFLARRKYRYSCVDPSGLLADKMKKIGYNNIRYEESARMLNDKSAGRICCEKFLMQKARFVKQPTEREHTGTEH